MKRNMNFPIIQSKKIFKCRNAEEITKKASNIAASI